MKKKKKDALRETRVVDNQALTGSHGIEGRAKNGKRGIGDAWSR